MSTRAIGLVGCGRLAQVGYLPALRAVEDLRLVAVADPAPPRRAQVARPGRVAAFATAADLLEATAVDGLVLATPASAHLADARRAAAAGIPTLVEKPPAPDAPAAAGLAELTPPPRVGFNRRFDPRTARVRDAAVGTGLALRLELRYRRRSWRAHTVADDALLDLGPHLIDLARWVTGQEVTAVEGAVVSSERASFRLVLTGGRAAVRCATDRPHRERIEVRAADGRVLARAGRGGLVAGLWERLRPGPHPLVASLARQLEAFAAALDGTPAPDLATAADGAAVMAVVDAVRASARRGGDRVDVAMPA